MVHVVHGKIEIDKWEADTRIDIAIEDLAEEDRRATEQELEEEMAERHRRKLACFLKMRHNIVKKADTAAASSTKVNSSSLNPEDLIQSVDVSVRSKYGTDLTQFMRVVAEDMRNMLETFKTDLNNSLPRQVRSVIQQIQGEAQGKWPEGSPSTPHPGGTASEGNQGVLANMGQRNMGADLNLQQPFYQTMAYGPNIPLMGSGVPHRPVPDVFFPRTPAPYTPGMGNDVGGGWLMAFGNRLPEPWESLGSRPKGGTGIPETVSRLLWYPVVSSWV
jgi:hypothetical protein